MNKVVPDSWADQAGFEGGALASSWSEKSGAFTVFTTKKLTFHGMHGIFTGDKMDKCNEWEIMKIYDNLPSHQIWLAFNSPFTVRSFGQFPIAVFHS